MKVLKGIFGLLAFLLILLSIGVLAKNQESLNVARSIADIYSTNISTSFAISAIPIIIFSFFTSAYFGAVMSVNVKTGDKTRQTAHFGIKNIAYHPDILTPAGLKARTEMAHWSIILTVAISGAALGSLYELL